MNLVSWYVLILWIIVAVGFAGVINRLNHIVELLDSLRRDLRPHTEEAKRRPTGDSATHT